MAKKVKKKLNIKALFVILLTIYLIAMAGYYFFTMPIKSIIINGNTLISDDLIIDTAHISTSSSLFKTSTSALKRKLKSLDLIKEVKVRKSLTGILTINITEEKVLFLNTTNNEYAISNNKEISLDKHLLGIPTLINYTPSEIYAELNTKMSGIDSDIISLISEISYSPDIKNNITIDEYRFILKMNDGNTIYINIANFDKLKEYKRLYSTIEDNEKGIFYLDGNRKTVLFRTYEAELNQDINGKEPADELPT